MLTSVRAAVRDMVRGWAGRGETSYTMVVTTHHRTALLSRLLDYLEAEKAWFPLVILDSSSEGVARDNADRIARSPLDIRHATYPVDLDPYLKVREGLRQVETAYCSLCADDDIVLLPGLEQSLRVLARDGDVCATHGTYFNFFDTDSFDLSYVAYRGPSVLADEPLVRLRQLFSAYEAVYYAVYRTPVLQAVFRRVEDLRTVLGRELLTAALTALSGKVVRIDEFYYGRSTGESFAFQNWHPHRILADTPATLFEEYARLRRILRDEFGGGGETRERNSTVLDLIFLGYLQPFLRPDVLDLLIADRLQGQDAEATAAHLWSVFVRSERAPHPLEPLMDGGKFSPDRFMEKSPHTDYVLTTSTRTNASRTYRIFQEFLFPDARPPAVVPQQRLLGLLERLNAY